MNELLREKGYVSPYFKLAAFSSLLTGLFSKQATFKQTDSRLTPSRPTPDQLQADQLQINSKQTDSRPTLSRPTPPAILFSKQADFISNTLFQGRLTPPAIFLCLVFGGLRQEKKNSGFGWLRLRRSKVLGETFGGHSAMRINNNNVQMALYIPMPQGFPLTRLLISMDLVDSWWACGHREGVLGSGRVAYKYLTVYLLALSEKPHLQPYCICKGVLLQNSTVYAR